jgi:hypothetical protein
MAESRKKQHIGLTPDSFQMACPGTSDKNLTLHFQVSRDQGGYWNLTHTGIYCRRIEQFLPSFTMG